MKQVIKKVPSASLNIIGTFRTKNFEDEIKNLIQELELQSSVKISEQVTHSQIWGIINKHRVGVIPFRRTPLTEENTPTKLFEMMICGLELVVSKLPPAQFFLNNSVHWCDPDNINSDLIPVANAGLKLIVSNKGSDVRKNLLLSLIKDDKLELTDAKKLLSLIRGTFSPLNIAKSAVQNIISPV